MVVVNREQVVEGRENVLLLDGDIEEQIGKLCEEVNWKL